MEETISGLHAIEEALKRGNVTGTLLIEKSSSRIERLVELAEKRKCRVRRVTRRELEEASSVEEVRDALLILQSGEKSERGKVKDLKSFVERMYAGGSPNSLVVLLDGITDPHNVGAILRSCDLFGADLVVIPSRRSARINETVRRISAGAASYVPVVEETNIRRAVALLKEAGYWTYAADVEGDAPWSIDLEGRIAVVLGSEDKGVRRVVKEECDGAVAIPTSGHIDSLNVSVAAGILMYEYSRQYNLLR
jgi:23S rRNA (guanosine2251-2'-O)-methyltransferase